MRPSVASPRRVPADANRFVPIRKADQAGCVFRGAGLSGGNLRGAATRRAGSLRNRAVRASSASAESPGLALSTHRSGCVVALSALQDLQMPACSGFRSTGGPPFGETQSSPVMSGSAVVSHSPTAHSLPGDSSAYQFLAPQANLPGILVALFEQVTRGIRQGFCDDRGCPDSSRFPFPVKPDRRSGGIRHAKRGCTSITSLRGHRSRGE